MESPWRDGPKSRIHLYHQPKKTSQGMVSYYSLATCYKQDGHHKKRILQRIGRLTPEQADKYRTLLKAINDPRLAVELCSLDQVAVKGDRSYLDVLMLSALWERLGLDKIFSQQVLPNQKLSTEQVARILTINRLLAPMSKVKTIPWLLTTLLPKVLGFDPAAYGKTKVFRELDRIHSHKAAIEKLFATFSAARKSQAYDVYYFDGSTSWFEGSKCPLAKYDLEKTRGFFAGVVSLMLVTDKNGFPVAWDIEDGHAKDVACFKGIAKRLKDNGISEITYCFDRGVASLANYRTAAKLKAKFISGIKDNQIKGVLDLSKFQRTRTRILEAIKEPAPKARRRIVDIDSFLSHDQNIFFKDLGVMPDKFRYVASFNVDLFHIEQQTREKHIHEALAAIAEKNIELRSAKKDRHFSTTERDVLALLKKYQVKEFFDYTLLLIAVDKKVQSYRIECSLNKAKIQELSMTDGLLIYITDHVEKSATGFRVHASELIGHYKRKYLIENAFREMKSYLDLRPFHVRLEDHVEAHFDIAVISYFMNNFILSHLSVDDDLEDGAAMSLRGFYEALGDIALATELVVPSGASIFKLKPIPDAIKLTATRLGIASVLSPSLHASHGVFA